MKISVVGGGPAGLYFALLAKKRRPATEIVVYEQNPRDATYGFGIVLADRGLRRMQEADPQSFQRINAALYVTRHQIIKHREQAVFIEGSAYGGALPRLRLLNILQHCCDEVGVTVRYDTRLEDVPADADMVVGADGVNSAIRTAREADFAVSSYNVANMLGWYGTKKHFPYPQIVFRKTARGSFFAVAYPYSEGMSTFVAECDPATWVGSGMDRMSEEALRDLAAEIFAPELGGEPLQTNKSLWTGLRVVRCGNWSSGNVVLIGDALHSAHPSIGSGTRIAMEDSIALAQALAEHGEDVEKVFSAFRRQREPQKQKLLDATAGSLAWYENFPERMERMTPVELVFDYLNRTGRISDERLQQEFPEFVRRYGTFAAPMPQRSAAV